MNIVVISDIHSNLDALEAVVSNLPKYDELWCLGDIVGYGPQPNEVIDRIQELKPTVVLMGNHDQAVVTGDTEGFSSHAAKAVNWTREVIEEGNRRYLSTLKPSERIERLGRTLALYHASPRDALMEYIFPGRSEKEVRGLVSTAKAEIVLIGHTHIPMMYRYNGSVLANPGSVGQPRDGDRRACYARLTLSSEAILFEVERVEYDVKAAAERIMKSGLPKFLGERLYMGM